MRTPRRLATVARSTLAPTALLLICAACSGPGGGAGDGGPDATLSDAMRPDAPQSDMPGNPPPDGATPDVLPMGDGAPMPSAEWLVVRGNHIVHADGTPFHGRGANLHDTRSCSACSFMPADPAGVNRWADELIDNWHANFVRFLLESKSMPYNMYEVQWRNLSDDDAYYRDIQTIVAHMSSKPGVYILVTLFADPSIKENNGDYDSEWPTAASIPRYQRLAEAFYGNPRVLFGLTNEPHGPADRDAELAMRYQSAIDAIRAVENAHGAPHHIVVVQAPQGYARDLSYFVAHPLPGDNIAYEIHPYNSRTDFDSLIVTPSRTLPVIIGEYGPYSEGATVIMGDDDIRALWTTAQANGVPYIAWNFHLRCPPDMLENSASDGCGLSASTGYSFPRTAWGNLLHDHLATPW